jgi:hypothetical protein
MYSDSGEQQIFSLSVTEVEEVLFIPPKVVSQVSSRLVSTRRRGWIKRITYYINFKIEKLSSQLRLLFALAFTSTFTAEEKF